MAKKPTSDAPRAATVRSSGSASIYFGFVSVPVKLFPVASAPRSPLPSTRLHAKCGGKMKQQQFCPTDNEVVAAEDVVRVFEHEVHGSVELTDEELRLLETPRTDELDLVEFVPADGIDAVYFDKSYYLGPEAGGEPAYRLLVAALEETRTVGVGRYWTKGRDQAVLVRPYKLGLVLQFLHHADEFRSFDVVDAEGKVPFEEFELARRIIEEKRSDVFRHEEYRDEYPQRLRAAIEAKARGKQVAVQERVERPKVVNLLEALQATLGPRALPQSQRPEVREAKLRAPSSVRSLPVKMTVREEPPSGRTKTREEMA